MWYLLSANTTFAYTRADTLRGSNGTGRSWWDVQHYKLWVHFDIESKSINGYNTITLSVTGAANDSMQIDLQEPMVIDSILMRGEAIRYAREGNVWWLTYPFHMWKAGEQKEITIYYHGEPRTAVNPPWDGGIIWKKDTAGNPWVTVACQGLGASIWWPCKDIQSDEPDRGMDMYYGVPNTLQCISNGRLIEKKKYNNTTLWHWQVKNPINNYDASFYIGDYVHWSDTMMGEKGMLDLDYYVLRGNEAKARKQFAVVKDMLHCFEYWMGPYPFYEDGYKLVETPYLGMEHQSAIAYGNKYKPGYLGMDRSETGYGLLFDYIIIHETGHEWFGNNVTAKDIAENWIQEGFTTYSESLFLECYYGKKKANAYGIGKRRLINNKDPLIAPHGVQDEGTGDIYEKGATIVHMLRTLMHDDERFREMLRELGGNFYHMTVTSADIEQFIQIYATVDLKPFFEQYLRTTKMPTLEYYIKGKQLHYRFTDIVPGFTLPIAISGKEQATIRPTADWQQIEWKGKIVRFSDDFLISTSDMR